MYTGELTRLVKISFTLDSEPSVDPPEFTLTCQSFGGPATTVKWWRNGELVQEDSSHVTSQIIVSTPRAHGNTPYNNTLRVTGRDTGRYFCRISNAFPSSVESKQLIIFCKLLPCTLCYIMTL